MIRYLIIFTLVLLMCSEVCVVGQEQCTLTRETSPSVRGLHLGMSMDEARSKFPRSNRFQRARSEREDKDPLLALEAVVSESPLGFDNVGPLSRVDWSENREDFKGVDTIFLQFLDKKLVSFKVAYDSSVEWRSITEFTSQLSAGLSLPNAWRPVRIGSGVSSYNMVMMCDGFGVDAVVSRVRGGEVTFSDNRISATLEQRREAIKEKKRETFKP